MDNKSYQQIYNKFEECFPEFKQSIKEWKKCQFDKEARMVKVNFKNGCCVYFGTMKDEDGEWTWIANLDMCDKTKEKMGILPEEE